MYNLHLTRFSLFGCREKNSAALCTCTVLLGLRCSNRDFPLDNDNKIMMMMTTLKIFIMFELHAFCYARVPEMIRYVNM